MHLSTKAALLSGLVIPGMGHIFLKQYRRGTALIVTCLACFIVMVANVLQQTMKVLEKIEQEGGLIDYNKITELASQSTNQSDNFYFNFALIMISISWIVGIVDAYYIGKRIKDNATE